jgi:hypothetical protein
VQQTPPALEFPIGPHSGVYGHELEEFIALLSGVCYYASKTAGWWTDLSTGEPLLRNKGEMIALIHSELSEALEGVRKPGLMSDKIPEFTVEEEEMADALVRIFDYCAGHGVRVGPAFCAKLLYNRHRADHKMENRLAEGGKQF